MVLNKQTNKGGAGFQALDDEHHQALNDEIEVPLDGMEDVSLGKYLLLHALLLDE